MAALLYTPRSRKYRAAAKSSSASGYAVRGAFLKCGRGLVSFAALLTFISCQSYSSSCSQSKQATYVLYEVPWSLEFVEGSSETSLLGASSGTRRIPEHV